MNSAWPSRQKALRLGGLNWLLQSLGLVADGTRLRLLLLLRAEELSVAQLQEILGLPQSNISAQLAKLKSAGLITDRRSGKNRFYHCNAGAGEDWQCLTQVMDRAAATLREVADDQRALDLVLRKRQKSAQAYFDALAGKFGRHYVPGRSWKALGETLLLLMPELEIADLGAGEGTLAMLLAQRAKRVIAVDHSENMVAYGAQQAREHGFANLEYRLGDLEEPPIEPASMDLVLFVQALHHARDPQRALAAAHALLKPGGRIVVLDLLKHNFEKARELYADVWLGFGEAPLEEMLQAAGFVGIETRIVERESRNPQFQTLLAIANRAD